MTTYEWDIETTDDFGDIIDHNHANKLKDYCKTDLKRLIDSDLVLVRDDDHGRSWAYAGGSTLPIYFTDAYNRKVAKVPQKFHKELKSFLKN